MTASNHTYSRLVGLSSHPGSGTGMPQSMSRVMARGRTSSSRLRLNLSTLGRQPSRPRSQSPSASTRDGRSRKKWFDSTNLGASPLMRLLGLMRSMGSSWLPQLSHWSPRAPSYPQIGQVPSMNRSGSVRPVDGETAPLVVFSTMYPFLCTVRNISCTTA